MDENETYTDVDSALLMLRYMVRTRGLPASDETREYHCEWGLKALDMVLATGREERVI